MASTGTLSTFSEPPFSVDDQLNNGPVGPIIPDQPCLGSSSDEVHDFLRGELESSILEELSQYLWLVSAQTSRRVDALHVQRIKGRRVVITEDPKLHLVWYADVIFVKPIPLCLFNHDFWVSYLCSPVKPHRNGGSPLTKVAVGFLRTYALLIRHPSDLQLAIESHLLPADIDWNTFARFIDRFRKLDDNHVSPRYHFGQLRLTRLNWAVRLFRPSTSQQWWYYHEMYWSTSAYVERFFAPFLFVFGSFAIILTAMQVMVTVPVDGIVSNERWTAVARASWSFSIAMILLILLIWLASLGGMIAFWTIQVGYSVRTKLDKRRTKQRLRFPESANARTLGKV